MASSSNAEKRKRQPGKRCVVFSCDKTNADGVSLHQFPTDENIWKWIQFALRKRDAKGWSVGTGYICSDHFVPDAYENYFLKSIGLAAKLFQPFNQFKRQKGHDIL